MSDPTPHLKQCRELIATLKSQAQALVSETNEQAVRKQCSGMMTDMLVLQRLNRRIFEAVTAGDKELDSLKSATETNHLELQNNNYERTHLKREIPKHRDFPTPEFDKIEFATEDEIVQSAQKEAPDVVKDTHQMQLFKLRHELEARKHMSSLISDLEGRKHVAKDKVSKIDAKIDSVPELLQKIEAVAEPLAQLFPTQKSQEGELPLGADSSATKTEELIPS